MVAARVTCYASRINGHHTGRGIGVHVAPSRDASPALERAVSRLAYPIHGEHRIRIADAKDAYVGDTKSAHATWNFD
ncbi:hypothetical protein B296_00001920 [Ensete ventricosum]|uniref:Uncharacterized protein n=1 Tax=Ensete ventricosum TaxID=4639 RepID=A0A427AVB7_ENSVE|nr:hypothetical protein B296_00001920 [Ensete ventricosum]